MSHTDDSGRLLVSHLPLTKARVNLGAVIKRVRIHKEYIILEKDGLPVAGLMDIDEFEDYLDLRDPRIKRHLAASLKDSRAGKTRPADELLTGLRAADARARRAAGRKKRKPARA
jgi:PHD/YefM family antitoxin component YafN of YafNO toxin-antitoxin module